MSANRYTPHLLVLPEDDANRQLANGFCLHRAVRARAVDILPVAGGWSAVLEAFKKDYTPTLRRFPQRRMLLLIDFDNDMTRGEGIFKDIASELQSRVFVLGARTEPEDLKRSFGSFESLGWRLAEDCASGTGGAWTDPLLAHNEMQLSRMVADVRPFVFSPSA